MPSGPAARIVDTALHAHDRGQDLELFQFTRQVREGYLDPHDVLAGLEHTIVQFGVQL
jgi:hypothetical protein